MKLITRKETTTMKPEMRPTTLDALIPLFSWDKIPRTDLRLPAEIFPEGAST